MPAVLTARGRWRRLWSRSAPVLAAYATFQGCGIPIFLLVGSHDVEIDGMPTTTEWVVIGIVAAAIPVSFLVGWLVARLTRHRVRAAVGMAAAVVILVAGYFNADLTSLPQSAILIVVVLALTGLGIGSVLGWAVRMTLTHLASVGGLAVRALPVVLLTALVFFNTYVWLMAATINGTRLVLAMVFLTGIAAVFVVSTSIERVRPMLRSAGALPADNESLADTPFAAMPDPAGSAAPRLSAMERSNVVFVLAASQLVQISVVAAVTAGIYLILGLIVLTPDLLKEWTHVSKSEAVVLGWTVPVPDSLIHMSLFLGALTFMYVSARAVGDSDYRATFLDPRVDDLHVALIARDRYRNVNDHAGGS
ncbi:hypothetical protein AWC00_12410 [Mycobacterium conspicuum]|nr:hypothetical protein AWC00_12410 [Mycobacterium conspicuum]